MKLARSTGGLLAALLALALAITLANRSLPLVRNSLVYARASEHVIEHGYDPRPVVADSRLSYDKPILYAWASAPAVRALGTHDGLRLTSFVTTALYLLALVHFARSFRALLPPGGERLVLLFGGLGPCVFYQFWSAHPDGWFAALCVFAWSTTHRLATRQARDPRLGALLLGATLLVAVLLKNYGLVLCGACPLYLALHARALGADRAYRRRLFISTACVLALLALFVALAATGHNAFSRLEGEGGGVGQYGKGELWRSARGTWVALGIALLVQFQLALVLALRRGAWTRGLAAPLLVFGGTYVAGLMPFPTTFYNMRYFVPLFALAALPLARGASAYAASARRLVLGAHALVAVSLIALFDLAPIYRAAAPYVPRLEVDWIGVPLSLLDNLRMPLHLEARAMLDRIDGSVEPGATLYWLDVFYYRDAQQGVYERAGLVRGDVETRYAASRDFHPDEPRFYVWCASPRSLPAGLGAVRALGDGLYLVERS